MSTLVEVLKDDAKRRAVVEDGARLIESEVAGKRGISGMAVKSGYKAVKAIRPGVIQAALDMLLPNFAPALDPHYAKGKDSGDLHGYFRKNAALIAEDLLGVTDARAKVAENKVMKRAYTSLRPQAKKHVEESVPQLSSLIERHVG